MSSVLPGLEIERKFLVASQSWRPAIQSAHRISQSYLPWAPGISVRVRRIDDRAVMTFKTDLTDVTRGEWEVPIALELADLLFGLCPHPPIDKIRHRLPMGPHVWEIDQFLGRHEGLYLAEIELGDPEESFVRPDWLGPEVTHDPRYRNSALYREAESVLDEARA
ncbi:MAG: CYTH domain-containing protein [Rhodospirillales bacterium]|nr:CYTH domain-containing protein [Rhodospirillales bacterium]